VHGLIRGRSTKLRQGDWKVRLQSRLMGRSLAHRMKIGSSRSRQKLALPAMTSALSYFSLRRQIRVVRL
jgi:hypothetical protein